MDDTKVETGLFGTQMGGRFETGFFGTGLGKGQIVSGFLTKPEGIALAATSKHMKDAVDRNKRTAC